MSRPPFRRLAACLASAALAPLAGCRDAAAPEEALALCTGPVTVQAQTLAEGGRISWTPRCGLRALVVPLPPSAGAAGTPFWAIESDTRPIAPGVRYGERPAGTRTTAPAQSLPRGTTFVVWLYGERGQDPTTFAWKT